MLLVRMLVMLVTIARLPRSKFYAPPPPLPLSHYQTTTHVPPPTHDSPPRNKNQRPNTPNQTTTRRRRLIILRVLFCLLLLPFLFGAGELMHAEGLDVVAGVYADGTEEAEDYSEDDGARGRGGGGGVRVKSSSGVITSAHTQCACTALVTSPSPTSQRSLTHQLDPRSSPGAPPLEPWSCSQGWEPAWEPVCRPFLALNNSGFGRSGCV